MAKKTKHTLCVFISGDKKAAYSALSHSTALVGLLVQCKLKSKDKEKILFKVHRRLWFSSFQDTSQDIQVSCM